jgi:hypothetical protein
MKNRTLEEMILRSAAEQLREATGLNVEVHPAVAGEGPNGVIQITWQDMEWRFAAEVKHTPTLTTAVAAVQGLRSQGERRIIIAGHIPPSQADLLKETDIPFMDAAGNAYLNEPPLYVFIKGKKPVQRYVGRPPLRAFRPTGLQVIFVLLCNPGMENARYREIASTANVALGTVGWVMQDLRQIGLLVEMGRRGRRLVEKEKLLERWVAAYPEQLKPKKLLGIFKATNPDWWRDAELPPTQAYWGGETAAAKFSDHLKPQRATIYTNELRALAALMVKNEIRQDPNGNIEIVKRFWNFESDQEFPALVHPILIYADLLATADFRNIETARIIYDTEVTRFIRGD